LAKGLMGFDFRSPTKGRSQIRLDRWPRTEKGRGASPTVSQCHSVHEDIHFARGTIRGSLCWLSIRRAIIALATFTLCSVLSLRQLSLGSQSIPLQLKKPASYSSRGLNQQQTLCHRHVARHPHLRTSYGSKISSRNVLEHQSATRRREDHEARVVTMVLMWALVQR